MLSSVKPLLLFVSHISVNLVVHNILTIVTLPGILLLFGYWLVIIVVTAFLNFLSLSFVYCWICYNGCNLVLPLHLIVISQFTCSLFYSIIVVTLPAVVLLLGVTAMNILWLIPIIITTAICCYSYDLHTLWINCYQLLLSYF